MSNVKVLITQVSGERLWGIDTSLPSQLQISVNVNLLGFERKSPEKIEAPFVFTASFTPSVAQINIKGRAQTGTVVAAGPGYFDVQSGEFRPMGVKVGDRIFVKEFDGYIIRYKEHEFFVFAESEILGKILEE